ncbi:D-alanine--D-alanine ligase [Candidatus Halobeggiatoa sp. HSG11]|nr:D-alanine--D-alanine ligase [Candidatus Halobeggiatoa sp. HSG11]
MQTNFGKVAVLMGGKSAEREISLLSGQAVLQALLNQNIDAEGIDTKDDFINDLAKFDRVFIALHGRGGEDGSIQGLLELMEIPYTGSGILGSALALDKYRTKQVWHELGLPTPASNIVNINSNFSQLVEQLGLPLMIKPILEGSSVGMTKVNHLNELEAAVVGATKFNCPVLAESYISGLEYTAAILNNQVLPMIRLETPRDFYDFTAKYSDDTETKYICPCGLPTAQEQKLQGIMLKAFLAAGASNWGRVDFICDKSGQPWLLEVNTVPGMTNHSLVPMAAKQAGINFDELVLNILSLTI